MQTTIWDVLKAYAQNLGWAVGIVVSLAGVYFAKKKLEVEQKRLAVEKRKISHDERVQLRIEWKEREPVYKETLKIIESCIVHGNVSDDELEAFRNVYHQSRTLFPKVIQQYLSEIYLNVSNLQTWRLNLNQLNKTKELNVASIEKAQVVINAANKWLREQIDFNDLKLGTLPDRRIDRMFFDYMGIE